MAEEQFPVVQIGPSLRTISYGHGLRTKDRRGLKIFPTREVFLRIVDEDGRSLQWSCFPADAIELASRLRAFAEKAAELGDCEHADGDLRIEEND